MENSKLITNECNDISMVCHGLNNSANIIYQNNKEKGFWDGERNVGEMLMLVVSELGEAMEAHRKGKFSDIEKFDGYKTNMDWIGFSEQDIQQQNKSFEVSIKDSFEDEIADTIIRLLDLSAGLGIDIERHINLKIIYNKSREKLHGKLY